MATADTACGLAMALESILPAASDAFIYGRMLNSGKGEAYIAAASRKLSMDLAFAKKMVAKARAEQVLA